MCAPASGSVRGWRRLFLVLEAIVIFGCLYGITEAQAVTAAQPAIRAQFPDSYDGDKPYHAEFKDGIWWVHGTVPTNKLGGTAEALVEDRSGKVLKVWHTQ